MLGLILSMFAMHYIAQFAIQGFAVTNLAVVTSTTSSSILAFIFGNIVLITLIIMLAHKAHEIIYETADNVMKWIGFGVHPLGETKGEAMTGQSFSRANQTVGMAAGAMISRTQRNPNATNTTTGPGGGPSSRDATPQGGTEVDRARTGPTQPTSRK